MHTNDRKSSHTPQKKRRSNVAIPINMVGGSEQTLYEQVPFSMSLKEFLDRRSRALPFRIGQWLATVDNQRMEMLLETYRVFSTSDIHDPATAHCRNDMLTLLMTALPAERGRRSMNERAKNMVRHIDSLGVAIRLETWRRKGWVVIEGDLTILQQKPAAVAVTDRMRTEAPDLYGLLQAPAA
jgi:hypothetical protein